MVDLDKALLDPASVFKTPEGVLNSHELSREQTNNGPYVL